MDQNTHKKERGFCSCCGARKYMDLLRLLFKHPVLCPKGVYVCRDFWDAYPERVTCYSKMKAEINMYANTGEYSVVLPVSPVKGKRVKS